MEVDSVDVLLRSHAENVPRHAIAQTHVQPGQVPEHVAIESCMHRHMCVSTWSCRV